jgi:hypothetical protein
VCVCVCARRIALRPSVLAAAAASTNTYVLQARFRVGLDYILSSWKQPTTHHHLVSELHPFDRSIDKVDREGLGCSLPYASTRCFHTHALSAWPPQRFPPTDAWRSALSGCSSNLMMSKRISASMYLRTRCHLSSDLFFFFFFFFFLMTRHLATLSNLFSEHNLPREFAVFAATLCAMGARCDGHTFFLF